MANLLTILCLAVLYSNVEQESPHHHSLSSTRGLSNDRLVIGGYFFVCFTRSLPFFPNRFSYFVFFLYILRFGFFLRWFTLRLLRSFCGQIVPGLSSRTAFIMDTLLYGLVFERSVNRGQHLAFVPQQSLYNSTYIRERERERLETKFINNIESHKTHKCVHTSYTHPFISFFS